MAVVSGPDKGRGAEAVVVVAVRAAARDISKAALVWALTHVVQHGDTILLLAVMPPPHNSGIHALPLQQLCQFTMPCIFILYH
jgi:hypothetical protein